MRKYFFSLIANPLFSGSAVMIIGSNFTNFINYIYHLIMGRLLGPAVYGELATLISIIGLLGMIPLSLGLMVTKFISSSSKKQDQIILTTWFGQKVFLFGLAIFVLIVASSGTLASFLNINRPYLVMVAAASLLFSLPASIYRSSLQGLLRFNKFVLSVSTETIIKLILGGVLVYWGLSIDGAIYGLLLATIIGWLLAHHFISDYLSNTKISRPKLKPLIDFSVPVLVQALAMTSLYSTDLILVKHFLPPYEAGLYAALSSLGKIIFFGAGPIGAVMFPLVAKRQAQGNNYQRIFLLSVVLTLMIASAILTVYWLFPQLAIGILFGKLYLSAANLLFWIGVVMTLFTLSSLLINFNLSLGKTRVVILPLIAAIIQVGGIWLYHDSLMVVISVSLWVVTFLLIALLLYSRYADFKKAT